MGELLSPLNSPEKAKSFYGTQKENEGPRVVSRKASALESSTHYLHVYTSKIPTGR